MFFVLFLFFFFFSSGVVVSLTILHYRLDVSSHVPHKFKFSITQWKTSVFIWKLRKNDIWVNSPDFVVEHWHVVKFENWKSVMIFLLSKSIPRWNVTSTLWYDHGEKVVHRKTHILRFFSCFHTCNLCENSISYYIWWWLRRTRCFSLQPWCSSSSGLSYVDVITASIRVPIGASPAWLANLMSCVLDAAASTLICLTVHNRTKNVFAGILAAGLFSFSPTIWLYAVRSDWCSPNSNTTTTNTRIQVQAEVFALNNFLVALVLYLYDRFEIESKTERMITKARWGTFVCALAHQSAHDVVSGRSDCIACFGNLETSWRWTYSYNSCCGLRSVPLFVSPDYTSSSQGWLGWHDNYTWIPQTFSSAGVRNLPTHGRRSRRFDLRLVSSCGLRSKRVFRRGSVCRVTACMFGYLLPQVRYVIPLVCFAIHLGVLSYLRTWIRIGHWCVVYIVDLGNRRISMCLLGGDGFARVVRRRIPKHVWFHRTHINLVSTCDEFWVTRLHDSHHIRTYEIEFWTRFPRTDTSRHGRFEQQCHQVRTECEGKTWCLCNLTSHDIWVVVKDTNTPLPERRDSERCIIPENWTDIRFWSFCWVTWTRHRFSLLEVGTTTIRVTKVFIYDIHTVSWIESPPRPEIYDNVLTLTNKQTGTERQFPVKPAFPIRDFKDYASSVWNGVPPLEEAPPGEEFDMTTNPEHELETLRKFD